MKLYTVGRCFSHGHGVKREKNSDNMVDGSQAAAVDESLSLSLTSKITISNGQR